jgi:pimeloyl-ACP methyl ester carboxylesterase
VPGFTGSKEDFIAVLPLLAAEGVGALAFDQLGQFESDGSDDPADYALPLLAMDIGEVVDVAAAMTGRKDPPHLLGHSFGGLVVQEAVAGGTVQAASLTLLCTGPGALPPDRRPELPQLVAALDEHDLATIWRIMRELEEAEDAVAPPAPIADFLERRWHANHPMQMRELALLLMQQPSLTERLTPRVRAGLPTIVMWGELDDAWPVEQQAAMADALGAAVVVLPGLGHSPNAQDPRATTAALLGAWAAGR